MNRTVTFVIRLIVGLLLPGWGLALIILGIFAGRGWRIATGVVVRAICVVLFARQFFGNSVPGQTSIFLRRA
jgi:hypothetical protein